MLIDLHTHTYPKSSCSSLRPVELVQLSKNAGLDGVCLTEHDTLWDLAEARRLGEEHGFVVLRGMEITTEVGHVLVFGLDHRAAVYSRIYELADAVKRAGAAMVLAHPHRISSRLHVEPDILKLFCALEGINGTDVDEQNAATQAACRELRMSATAGTDTHATVECGVCGTHFDKWITNEEELVAELRAGRCRPVDLRPPKG